LPEPDSPVIATGAMLRAIRAMLARTSCTAWETPSSIVPADRSAAAVADPRSAGPVAAGPGSWSAERTSARNASSPTGLAR